MNRFVFILFTPLLFIACAPKITKLVKKIKTSDGLDTMIFEKKAIGSSKFCDEKGKNCTYTLDGKPAIKAEYDYHEAQWANLGNCKPCWLKYLDKDGQLFYEGDFYQDCCIGTYIKRYSNGKIKVKGQYKIPPKELIENGNLYENGYCRVHGEWIYYNINGEIEKREIYEDGKLVK